MSKSKRNIVLASFGLIILGMMISLWNYQNKNAGNQAGNTFDDALLALIKNDEKAFVAFLNGGGNVHGMLPHIDGKAYSVSEGMAYFERPSFMRLLHERKLPYLRQESNKAYDILSLSVPKNNPEMLRQLMKERPKMDLTYSEKKLTLLHLASIHCSYKLAPILHEEGKLNWNTRAFDGSTPLTLAAESECLPVLSYWKEQKADFSEKDARGLSAMGILKNKKDAALMAFVQSFELRRPASTPSREPNFYLKRKIPKDQIVDYSAIIEPEVRPLEAVETAEFSEFSD